VNSDGSQLTLLAGEPPYNNEPSWSPSSDSIAFVYGQYDRLNIYVVKMDGQGPFQLTHDTWSSDPAWSPDSTASHQLDSRPYR
jgi:Tol biopolymer transport system component